MPSKDHWKCSFAIGQWSRKGHCLLQSDIYSTRVELLCHIERAVGSCQISKTVPQVSVWPKVHAEPRSYCPAVTAKFQRLRQTSGSLDSTNLWIWLSDPPSKVDVASECWWITTKTMWFGLWTVSTHREEWCTHTKVKADAASGMETRTIGWWWY